MAKTVLITGTSSGIGRAAAEFFSDQGWNVVAAMRKPDSDAGHALVKRANVAVIALDVTDDFAIEQSVNLALERFGRLDALVNNAGYGLAGPMEFATREQIQRQFNTNLIGPIRLMQAVLPTMRAQGSGTIANISSLAGRVVFPLNSLYHGTKYGLEGVSESAALELAPFGIRIRIIEPGWVKTDFTSRSLVMTQSSSVSDYDKTLKNSVAPFTALLDRASEPLIIVKVIYEALIDESDKIRYIAGEDAKVMLKERLGSTDEEHQLKMKTKFNCEA